MATTGQWIKFFLEAGIPSSIASKYATIFHENRIKVDMLLDLNKEYLKDMGITVMGDIIAILKYAKETHDKVTQEKVLGPDSSASNSHGKHVANRILGRYVKKKPEEINIEKLSKEAPGSKVSLVNIKRKVSQTEEVPTKKVRRVLPEQEGGYIVKMPLGTTPKTKKLLNEVTLSRKQSIFERLGDSNVSSTTELESQQFTVTGLNCPLIRTGKGIFSRLGNQQKNESVINFNESYDKDVTLRRNGSVHDSLAYRGVMKHLGVNKSVSANTSRARYNNGIVPRLGLSNTLFNERRVTTTPHINGGLAGKLLLKKSFTQQQFNPRGPRVIKKVTGPGQNLMLSKTVSLSRPRKSISFDRHLTSPSRSVFSRLGSN